jgi:hypothetical protein
VQLLKETEDPVRRGCSEGNLPAAALGDAGAHGSGAAQAVAGAEPGSSTVLSDLSGLCGTWLQAIISQHTHFTSQDPETRW